MPRHMLKSSFQNLKPTPSLGRWEFSHCFSAFNGWTHADESYLATIRINSNQFESSRCGVDASRDWGLLLCFFQAGSLKKMSCPMYRRRVRATWIIRALQPWFNFACHTVHTMRIMTASLDTATGSAKDLHLDVWVLRGWPVLLCRLSPEHQSRVCSGFFSDFFNTLYYTLVIPIQW